MERENHRLSTSFEELIPPQQPRMAKRRQPLMALGYRQICRNPSLGRRHQRPRQVQRHHHHHPRQLKVPRVQNDQEKRRAIRKMHQWMKKVMRRWRIPRMRMIERKERPERKRKNEAVGAKENTAAPGIPNDVQRHLRTFSSFPFTVFISCCSYRLRN